MLTYKPENFYKTIPGMKGIQGCFETENLVPFNVREWDDVNRRLIVEFADGIKGYLPEEEVCLEKLKYISGDNAIPLQADVLIGRRACALVTKIENNEVFLSRKKLQEKALASLKIGRIYNVYIKKIFTLGIYVDVGAGLTGFIHFSEITKTQFNTPNDLREPYGIFSGATICAKLLSIESGIKLSFRQTFDFPLLSRGNTVYGYVRNGLPDGTGYFVDISPNDTAIVDSDFRLDYGTKILVKVKYSEYICEDEDKSYFRHHVNLASYLNKTWKEKNTEELSH